MAANKREPRLDAPRDFGRRFRRRAGGQDRFGTFAEAFARFLGTSRFLMWMTVFIIAWIAVNAVSWSLQFDRPWFVLLNLVFSVQAAYAAPLILLAQNRQEDRDRVVAEQERRMGAAARADMEFLAREMASLRMALGEVATRDFVRSELRELLNELDQREDEGSAT